MFKFFRKKKKVRVIKCSNLFKLQKIEGLDNSYNITISSYLQDFQVRVQSILNELHIYDDRVWIEAYREYQLALRHFNYQLELLGRFLGLKDRLSSYTAKHHTISI